MKKHNTFQIATQGIASVFFVTLGIFLLTAASARADYPGTILADNPLAYYALNPGADGTNNAPDLSGNGNNGDATNIIAAVGPTEFITNAAYFNGASLIDLSQGGNAGILDFTGPITMEAWAQPNSSSLFGDILAKGYDGNINNDEIVIRVNGPYGANYFGSSGTAGVSGGVQTTNWAYIVLSSDGTNTSLYQNGVLVAQTADTTGSIQFPDDWVIGDGSVSGNTRFFQGNISEVALYDYGLSAAQVLNHYYEALLNSPASNSPPLLTSLPQSVATISGASATFSVSVLSAYPTTNQWYLNGSPLAGQTNATLNVTDISAGSTGTYMVVVGNQIGTTNASADLSILTVSTLVWSSFINAGVWDLNTTPNWTNVATLQQTVFTNYDEVIFNDVFGAPTLVTVSSTVEPSLMTVDASTNNYTFGGSGAITGPGSLIKQGTSILTIDTPPGLSGSVLIEGGAISAASNTFSYVSSISISNGATLDVAGSSLPGGKPITVSGFGLNGEGAIYNSVGDYPSENVNITLTGDTKFGGSARWDLATGSTISGPYNLTVDWSAGAGYGQWNSVGIDGVASINVTNGSSLGMTGMDNSFEDPTDVVNVATNGTLALYSGGFNGSVNLYSGAQMVVYPGNVNLGGSTLHIYSGATMDLYAQGIALTGNNLILENEASLQSFYNSGINPINNQVILNGVAHLVVGDHYMLYTNVISGPGGFVMDYYNHGMILDATDTYTGPTIIGDGPEVYLTNNGSISDSSLIFFGGDSPQSVHVDVSARSDQTFTLASGQTLEGIGSVNGYVVVTPGATISPGGTNTTIGITTGSNATGTLSSVFDTTLGGTTLIKLDGSGSNDVVEAQGQLNYGGTLSLVNVSGAPYSVGDTFQIFQAGIFNGSFSTITPTTPGSGLAWDVSQLNNGIIAITNGTVSQLQFTNSVVSGGNLVFGGSGGTPNGTYTLLTTTNLSSPWVPIATNSFDANGSFSVTNSIAEPQQFFTIGQ